MRLVRKKMSKTIVEKDAEVFDEMLNEFLQNCKGEPVIKFHDMGERLSVTVIADYEERVPESISDEYELKGISYYCADCMYCEPPKNKDGSIDKRVKWWNCTHFDKKTWVSGGACEFFYTMLDAKQEILKNE